MSDWPYSDPDAAHKTLTRMHLESELWSKICERVASGEWSCEAYAEDEVTPTPLTGFLLRRASPDFQDFTIYLVGRIFLDLSFIRERPKTDDDRIKEIVSKYCNSNDPASGTVKTICKHVNVILGEEFSESKIRTVMRQLDIPAEWKKPGRRSVRK